MRPLGPGVMNSHISDSIIQAVPALPSGELESWALRRERANRPCEYDNRFPFGRTMKLGADSAA